MGMALARSRATLSAWIGADLRTPDYPPAPPGQTIYAVGDIHGRVDCLRRAHALIDRDAAARGASAPTEVYIGDYVDRGPDSKGVIDLLTERARAASPVFLRGNHELVMESFLSGRVDFADWRPLGGLETILSYGVDARALLQRGRVEPRHLAEKMPLSHVRFLAGLQDLHTIGCYCFTHAGLRPGVAIALQSEQDLAWIRKDFLAYRGSFGSVVVHGHTPTRRVDFRSNRINIDTGAYLTNRLSVLRIDADGPAVLCEAAR